MVMRLRWCSRKARRKEREGEPAGDPKLYLQEALLERKLPELDMRQLVELPHGLDYNEWLASHSQYTSSSIFPPSLPPRHINTHMHESNLLP